MKAIKPAAAASRRSPEPVVWADEVAPEILDQAHATHPSWAEPTTSPKTQTKLAKQLPLQ